MKTKKIKSLFRRSRDDDEIKPFVAFDPSSLNSKPLPPRPSTDDGSFQTTSPQQPLRAQNTTRYTALDGPQSQKESTIRHVRPTSARRSSRRSSFKTATSGTSAMHGSTYLPPLNHLDPISTDFEHLSLGGDDRLMTSPSSKIYSEDVADRNSSGFSNEGTPINTSGNVDERHNSVGKRGGQNMRKDQDNHYTGANEYEGHNSSVPNTGPHQLRQLERPQGPREMNDPSRSSASPDSKRDSIISRKPVGSGNESSEPIPGLRGTVEQRAAKAQAEEERARKSQAEAPSLDGVVDLTNTVDTDVREQWAPAVTHETVIPQVHNIRDEHIYRAIHNHTYLHRTQPVLDFEVLPARHFVPNTNGDDLVEVKAEQLPDCTGENQKWFIAEKRSTATFHGQQANGTRPLMGLSLDEHDEKISMGPGGVERKETTWVYPPTLEDPSTLRGPTYPVHFGDCDDDCAVPQNWDTKPNGHAEQNLS